MPSVFGLPAAPAPVAGAVGDCVAGVTVADLFSGAGFRPGVVPPCAGPVVPSVFGLPAAPAPVAGPVGGVVVGVVVDNLFSRPGFALRLVTAGVDPFGPLGRVVPPFMPGRVLSAGNVLEVALVCDVLAVVPFWPDCTFAIPADLAVPLMTVLGGAGALPLRIAAVLFFTVSGV